MFSYPAHARRSLRRSGFTLIELLIVLAIITVLLSISWVVYGAAVENARIAATRATIRQLDSALQERLKAFYRVNLKSQAQTFKQRYDAGSGNPPATIPLPLKVAEIVVRKDRYRAALPQRLEDLWGFDGRADTPDDSPLWRVWKQKTGLSNRTVTAPDPLESSELLYLALTNGGAFGAPVLPLDRLRSNHVRDENGNNLPELYDEWGQPLRFYNWPARLVRPQGEMSAGPPIVFADISLVNFRGAALPLIPSLPKTTVSALLYNTYSHPLNQDPDDPTGALVAFQNDRGLGLSGFQLAGAPFPAQPLNEDFYGTFDTYSVPLIVSAGPDGRLGLNEPSLEYTGPGTGRERLAQPLSLTDLDPLTDNITNRQP